MLLKDENEELRGDPAVSLSLTCSASTKNGDIHTGDFYKKPYEARS